MAYARRLEAGPWFSVGEQLDGPTAYQRVLALRDGSAQRPRPYVVYVHVPFCESICSFCALYTFGLGNRREARLDRYLDAVLRSLEQHPWYGAAEPPTTVHFGGGTPLVLGMPRFERLVRGLIDAFGTSPACEWAIETTTSALDGSTVDALEALNFQRIHLGIQTLDDAVRARIGRRESGPRAVERVTALEARGFLTSVDLILGLAGVSEAVVERDLRTLYGAGVRMFSICELRERSGAAARANQDEIGWARRHYRLWETIWRFMQEVGLVPIHMGQFARTQADNLYYTHPARGEDCVAIGPYAHGSVDALLYGNLLLPEYYQAIQAGITSIAMGVDYRAGEEVICALERELLTHHVSQKALDDVGEAYPDRFQPILEAWVRNGLLRTGSGQTGYALTVSGSWFVGNMILEVRHLAETSSSVGALSGSAS